MCIVSKDVFKHTYKLVCVFQEAASKMKKIYKRFMKGKACEGKWGVLHLGMWVGVGTFWTWCSSAS